MMPEQGRRRTDWGKIALNVLMPVSGVIAALCVGAVMLLALKVNPLTAYAALLNGASAPNSAHPNPRQGHRPSFSSGQGYA